MNRRELLHGAGAAALSLGVFPFPPAWSAAEGKRKKVLMYTRSEGFQHGCVRRPKPDQLSLPPSVARSSP